MSLFVAGAGPSVPPQVGGEITSVCPPPAAHPVESWFRLTVGFMRFASVAGDVVFQGPTPYLVSGVTQINARIPGRGSASEFLNLRMKSPAGEEFTDQVAVSIGYRP